MTATRVLIIDDEPETVSMLKAFLDLFGFEVRTALTGTSGLKAVAEFSPHALILDLMLPDTDGYEVCRLLRDYPGTQTLPIIILSARTSHEDVKRGYAVGATRYLKKPVNLDVLLEEVRAVVAAVKHAPPSEEQQEKDAKKRTSGI